MSTLLDIGSLQNNRRSLLMKTKSKIKLFATATLAIATIGATTIYADAQINRDTANDSVEIISDPYKTYEEADKALNDVKNKYLEEYGSYRAGVVPTEDLKNYEVYAIIRKVSLDETSEKTVQNVAKALSSSKSVESAKPTEEVKPVTPSKPAEDVKPVTPAKPVEDIKPETPTKPVDEGKTSTDIQEITGEFKFTEIKTTSTGLTFKAKLPEVAPHAGPVLPNIQATLTDKATGKEVAKTGVVLEGLSDEFKTSNALLYSNLLEGTIFEPSLISGNYILTVEGTTGPTYGQNTDKRKRHFIFSTEVTLTGEGNATTTTQPEKLKNSTTEPKSDQTTNNNQQPSNDQNKQSTNNNTGKQDKNELSTNKTSDTKTDKQNSDNTLSQEKQQTTSTSTTKPDDNKNNDKKILPNTGESTSILGIIGTVLSITGLGFIVKRKRG